MEVARQASISTLDKDTSRRLVSFLRVKEVIQMSQVCKAFWEISCGTSTLYCSLSFSQAPQEADASLMRFIQSRCQQGMEVEMLHLVWWDRQLHPTLDRSIVAWCNEMQPVLAPSLTTLILGNLKPPEMRRKGQLTAALSACQRLRHLALCLWLDPGRRSPSPSASVDWGFIAETSQALPSLRALEFHFGHYDWQDPDVSDKEVEALVDKMSWKKYHDMGTVHFDQAFVARVASREGMGLQLLQLEVGFAIGQESCMRLPASLRYLSTSCSAAADYVGRMHKKTRAVALEEMALFVDHSYTAHSPELHTPSQNVAIQSYFNALLLPAATTLKAVAFLYYCKRGFTPSPYELTMHPQPTSLRYPRPLLLPHLRLLSVPWALWVHLCCCQEVWREVPDAEDGTREDSEEELQDLPLWPQLTTLFVSNDEYFAGPTVSDMDETLAVLSQCRALHHLRLNLSGTWNGADRESDWDMAFAMLRHAPGVKHLIIVHALYGGATIDRDLVDFIERMGQALHSLSALERLGVILVDMEGLVQGEPPVPTTDMMLQCGVPLAHQQGAEGVCTALGSLVQQGRLPVLKEVVLCPVSHNIAALNGYGGCYSGPLDSPFQAPHVECRALSFGVETLLEYELCMFCNDNDTPEERECMSRMISQMYL